jgi:hypothetical protein
MLLKSFSNQFSEFASIPLITAMQRCSPLSPSIMLPTHPTSCVRTCVVKCLLTHQFGCYLVPQGPRLWRMIMTRHKITHKVLTLAFLLIVGGNWSVLHICSVKTRNDTSHKTFGVNDLHFPRKSKIK